MNSKYLIDTAVGEYPDNLAFIGPNRRLTFNQLDTNVNRLANAILDLGIRKGDRVGILLQNCAAYIETDFALSNAGMVRVALNYRLGTPDHEYVLNDAGAKALIYGEEFTADVKSMKRRLSSVEKFICVSKKSSRHDDADFYDFNEIIAASSAMRRSRLTRTNGTT